MKQKQLGQTGTMIPEIGQGTWRYTAGSHLLRRGVELGACLIDTAEAYGNEDLVGRAIKDLRGRVFLATKVSRRHFRYPEVLKSADQSLHRLNTDCIDLYQLHRPTSIVPIEETMAAMEHLVDVGKVRFIGVSNFAVSELKRAQAAARKYRIVCNQVRYNLVDRRTEFAVLPFCRQQDITVIAYSPLAQGVKNLLARDPRRVLEQVAAMTGRTVVQVALNWCLTKDRVVVIPKASSVEHLAENCGASGWSLTPDQIRILDRHIRYRPHYPLETIFRRLARHLLDRIRRV